MSYPSFHCCLTLDLVVRTPNQGLSNVDQPIRFVRYLSLAVSVAVSTQGARVVFIMISTYAFSTHMTVHMATRNRSDMLTMTFLTDSYVMGK